MTQPSPVTSAFQLDELLQRVAEAVRQECANAGNDPWMQRVRALDIDAIIASVKDERPAAHPKTTTSDDLMFRSVLAMKLACLHAVDCRENHVEHLLRAIKEIEVDVIIDRAKKTEQPVGAARPNPREFCDQFRPLRVGDSVYGADGFIYESTASAVTGDLECLLARLTNAPDYIPVISENDHLERAAAADAIRELFRKRQS